jgi:hypothetical protein
MLYDCWSDILLTYRRIICTTLNLLDEHEKWLKIWYLVLCEPLCIDTICSKKCFHWSSSADNRLMTHTTVIEN